MGAVKIFTDGGSLLPSDLNEIESDYEQAFSSYRQLMGISNVIEGAAGALTYLPASYALPVAYLDPSLYAASPRTTYYRLKVALLVNSIANAATFEWSLVPITAVSGTSTQVSLTAGSVVSGSTVAVATPTSDSLNRADSGDFAAPSAGYYAIAMTITSALTTNQGLLFSTQLLYRNA